jgi:hypothetical protein
MLRGYWHNSNEMWKNVRSKIIYYDIIKQNCTLFCSHLVMWWWWLMVEEMRERNKDGSCAPNLI